jgi:TolB-like protein
MVYRFGTFELDLARVELRADGELRGLEPQVFALLALLIENRERLISKEEIVEKVWDGRSVSDGAIASRIKSVRKALGDDGKNQRYIKTIHGKGFRFVADARMSHTDVAARAQATPATLIADLPSRPSIAVLPFRLIGDAVRCTAIADGLPHELISELSRLRWLFVTARGSSFRLRGSEADMTDIGRLLGVRYCLSGVLEVTGERLSASIELVDTRDGGVVWAEHFHGSIDDVHQVREQIRSRILAALEIQVPIHEAALARLTVTENLDAWSAYHLGLQHLYRFNRNDNTVAKNLFQQAVARDASFARAHSGLSFAHFQAAFMQYTDDRPGEVALARRFATRGVELDPIDPFVNFTMGRTFWLEGDLESSLAWLERSTSISPNYAQGIYARSWTESLAGRALEARRLVDLAMRLSPLDPLYYAMLGTRAFTHMMLGEDIEATDWAERAARSPGAHVLIAMIAAITNALVDNHVRATWWADNVRSRNPRLTRQDFFRAFPMKSEDTKIRVANALVHLGF